MHICLCVSGYSGQLSESDVKKFLKELEGKAEAIEEEAKETKVKLNRGCALQMFVTRNELNNALSYEVPVVAIPSNTVEPTMVCQVLVTFQDKDMKLARNFLALQHLCNR